MKKRLRSRPFLERWREMRQRSLPAHLVLLLVLLVIVAGVAIPYILEVQAPKPAPGKISDAGQSSGVDLSGTHLVGRKAGTLQWEFRAESMNIDQEIGVTQFSNIKNGIFYEDGRKVAMTFTAGRALVSQDKKTIDLDGGITLKSPDGSQVFHAAGMKITIDERSSGAVCSGPVRLVLEGAEVSGDQATLDFNKRQFIITGNVILKYKEPGITGNMSTIKAVYSYSDRALEVEGKSDAEFQID